ncbi:hypothetical protein niasHT_016063 [Heterodera trifolii]|uniref:Copper transport protein n=1 Tax=Heterodera trifolii TaxID=157864 RepID=A0ABD2LF06_9BILA
MNGGYGFGGYGNVMMPMGYGNGAFSYGMSSPFVHFATDEYILFDFWHPFSSLGFAFVPLPVMCCCTLFSFLISYILMIIVMTLNGWLILSILLGHILAKLLLGLFTSDSVLNN